MNSNVNYKKYAMIFIGGMLALWAFFLLVPFIDAFILSFQKCVGASCEFTGLGNAERIWNDPVFWKALSNTLIFLAIQVPIMLFLALLLASLLNDSKLKFRGFFRTAMFLPAVTSLVAYAILFKMMFADSGVINGILTDLHLINEPIMWLTDPVYAKVVIILALLWRWTGYNMIFYLAAMQNIPSELYEAAKIDGASKVKIFFKVTIPQLKPIILFTTIMSTIGTLQLFDEIVNITAGGPGYETITLSQYIYNLSFKFVPDFGYAASISFVIVSIVVFLSIIQKKVAGDE